MRKKLAIAGSILLCCALITEFLPEAFALAWHVRHGRAARVGNKYDVRVPWSMFSQGGDDGTLTVTNGIGRFRSRLGVRSFGMMTISTMHSISAEEVRKGSELMDVKLGTKTTHTRTISVVGQELHCFEQRAVGGQLARAEAALGATQVSCYPSSEESRLSAQFLGSEPLLPAFYELLENIRPVAPQQPAAQ